MRKIALIPLLIIAACSGKVSIGSNGSTSGTLRTNPDGTPTGNGQTCEYGGKSASVGDRFPSPDGCNTCTCAADGAYCTEMGCAIDGGPSGVCADNGQFYNPGDRFLSSDGCNTCTCTTNGAACTEMGCAIDGGPAVCFYNGKSYTPGDSFPSSDGCNTCTCTASGVGCTKMACAIECQGAPGRKPGETWQEACNTCACDATGMVSCTASACACPPDGTISCKPPVNDSRCSGSYHQWIVANCPNVQFGK